MKRTVDDIFSSRQFQRAIRFHDLFASTRAAAEIEALTSVLYPHCASCNTRHKKLLHCKCCGVVHICSAKCWRLFNWKYPDHLVWGRIMFCSNGKLSDWQNGTRIYSTFYSAYSVAYFVNDRRSSSISSDKQFSMQPNWRQIYIFIFLLQHVFFFIACLQLIRGYWCVEPCTRTKG